MATSTTNYYIGPSDGWVQIAATAAKFLRVSGFPHTHPYYLYFGASAPALVGSSATGTATFSGGVPTNGQNVVIGSETYLFKTVPVDARDVQIVPATKGTGTVTFAGGVPTATQTVVIGSETYTFVAAASVPFDVTIGADAPTTAANFVTTIAANSTLVTATRVGGVVTVSSILLTAAGNYAMSDTATNVTTGGAMTGGQDGSLLTAAQFASSVNTNSALVTAGISGGVVTFTSKLQGTVGNYALTKTASNVAVSGALLTGGVDRVEGVLVCHKPFWSNVLTDQPCFARVVNPVPNSNRSDGKIRLDVVVIV